MKNMKLSDIEMWIQMVDDEKQKGIKGTLHKIGNRLSNPSMIFKSTNEWLEILEFEKKQEIERLEFFDNIKKKRGSK